MTHRADQARPPRKPMRQCPHCGKSNEPHRQVCFSCKKPMGCAAADQARREAIARVVAAAPPLTAQQIVTLRRIFAGAPSRQRAA